MSAFDEAVALTAQPDGSWLGHTSLAYANMVGPYGGITAAVLLNAALSHPERIGVPVAQTVNYCAPVTDGAFGIHARIVRNNRSTQHWTMQLVQHREVIATGTAVLAVRRQTWSAAEAVAPSGVPRPEQLPRAPIEGRPAWFQHYDVRFVDGAPSTLDGREKPDSRSRHWIRDDPARPLDFASLAAICDSFFPRVFLRRGVRTAVGTVSLTTFFHADEALLADHGDRHVLGVARALAFRNGFFDQSGEVWSHAGHLLASTHQVVYFRD